MKKFLLVLLHAALASPLLAFDDHNPIGVTGTFEGVITTGCAYNVLNHSATRQIDDIVVPGAIGKYGLKMIRYYNSRSTNVGGIMGAGWRHEYSWSRSSNSDKFAYPNGNVWDSHCTDYWGLSEGPLGVSDWPTTWNGYPAFRLSDGGTVVFQNPNWGVATKIIDPYGQETNITLGANGLITRVTEPGGRYLQFTYIQVGGQQMLTEVDAYDGQGHQIDSVVYRYASKPTGGNVVTSAMCLTQVDYSDGTTHAYYTYTTDNSPENPTQPCPCPLKLLPLLQTAQDVRYKGPMRQICYEYQPNGPHGAIIAEKYSLNGSTTGPRISRIDPPAPSPLLPGVTFPTTYTEYRGDGPTRTFHYTALSVSRPPNEDECPGINGPAPQQFLTDYTDFRGNSTHLGYDTNWYVNSVRDANTNTTTFDRGSPPPAGIGQITKVTHPDGTYIQYTYQPEPGLIPGHYVQTVRNERGYTTTYNRDGTNHQVYEIDYPDTGDYETFTYNSFGQVLIHRLRNGAYEKFAYDGRGLLTDKWNPKQNAIPAYTDPHTHYEYYTAADNRLGWIDRVKTVSLPANWLGHVALETYEYERTYDANGITNLNGGAVAGRGLPTKIGHADGTYRLLKYDWYGNKVSEDDELRNPPTSYTCDDYNRRLTMTDPLGRTTRYTYLPTNGTGTFPYLHTTSNPDTITTPTGIITSNDYDEDFRKISTTIGSSTTWFHYDAVGNQDWVTDPRGTVGRTYPNNDSAYTTYTDYDSRNRKWRLREPLGHTTEFHYDDGLNLTRIIRPDQTTETKTYDEMNRVLTDTVPKTANPAVNLRTWFAYNPSGTLSAVTDARGSGQGDPNYTTYFGYDASDRKKVMTYPDSSTQQWAYDDAGNLNLRTTVGGQQQAFFYDNRNFKYASWWNTDWNNGIVDWCFFDHDATGRLTEAENGKNGWNTNIISDVHRTYNAAGRLTVDQQILTGLPGGGRSVNYFYDNDGKLNRMYATGGSYDYSFGYDGMGRFQTISTTNGPVAFQYYYDAASNEIERDNFASGVNQLYPRDNLNRMQYLDSRKGNSTLFHEAYGYDLMNRVNSVTRNVNDADSFVYYLDGELSTAQYGSPSRSVGYTLDKAGNRTTVTDNVNGNASYSPNNINQYTAVGGNPVTNGNEHEIQTYNGVTYTYINDERLSSAATMSTTYSMLYDALGRCTSRTLNGSTTFYLYDGEKPVVEFDSTGAVSARNVYGKGIDEILMRTLPSTGGTLYYQHNHQGSVVLVTNAGGGVLERYKYDAFGAPSFYDGNWNQLNYSPNNNRFLFTGREYSAATSAGYNAGFKFYEYRARAYNPTLGRFMSEDPKLFVRRAGLGAAPAEWTFAAHPDEAEFNLFRYCGNDPIDFTDPMGLSSPAWAQAIIPGQVEWDNAVANWNAGNHGIAVGWGITMVAQQTLAVATLGTSMRVQQSLQGVRIAMSERQAVISATSGRTATTIVTKFYPENAGFIGGPKQTWLMPGQMIDRYGGSSSSRFFSPAGTAASARALPPGTESQPLRSFEVVKPFEVQSGKVAPWFYQPGGGIQYQSPIKLETLLKRGIIKEVGQ